MQHRLDFLNFIWLKSDQIMVATNHNLEKISITKNLVYKVLITSITKVHHDSEFVLFTSLKNLNS